MSPVKRLQGLTGDQKGSLVLIKYIGCSLGFKFCSEQKFVLQIILGLKIAPHWSINGLKGLKRAQLNTLGAQWAKHIIQRKKSPQLRVNSSLLGDFKAKFFDSIRLTFDPLH